MCEFAPFNFSGREIAIFREIINVNAITLRSFFVDVESEEQAAKNIKVRWIILIIFVRLKKISVKLISTKINKLREKLSRR